MKTWYVMMLTFWAACENEKPNTVAQAEKTPMAKIYPVQHPTFNAIFKYPYITGSTRNGIRAMEGVDFEVNWPDTTHYTYRFSIVNWRDKFKDITGPVTIDSSSIYQDNFFIKNHRDSAVAAYRLFDNTKKHPIWIGITKDGQFARVFQHRKDTLKELNYSLLWAK